MDNNRALAWPVAQLITNNISSFSKNKIYISILKKNIWHYKKIKAKEQTGPCG